MWSRFLYRQFARLWRIQRALTRRLTPAGQVATAVVIGAMIFGPNTRLTVSYQAFSLALALLVVAVLLSVRAPRAVEARRRLPRFATVGEPLQYTVMLHNSAAARRPGLSLLEEFDDPRPDFATFVTAREPDEARSSWFDRRVPYQRWTWLVERSRCLDVPEHALPAIPAGTAIDVRVTAHPRRRGRVRFRGLSVARRDPLGLVRALHTQPLADTLVVLPRRYPVPRVELAGSRRYQPGGVTLASSVGESNEFMSLRDYRPGDPLKRIHWRSWARARRPIVREFQDEFFIRHGLVLDTFVATPTDVFEDAVSVAASFVAGLHAQESLLDLMFVGHEAYVFTAGRGVGHIDGLLEVLADVRPCAGEFAALHRLVVERLELVSSLVCVLLAWDATRRAFVDQLRGFGVPMLVFVIGDDASSDGELQAAGIRRLTPGRIAEGLATL